MTRWLLLLFISLFLLTSCTSSRKLSSLVPNTSSTATDYFCTWTLQGYVTNFSSTETQRQAMNEKNIFGSGKYRHWDSLFPKTRGDLYFLLDDSWDVPLNGDKDYFGSLRIDTARFPSSRGLSPGLGLKAVSDNIKRDGWKGLGLWICAQEAPAFATNDTLQYWKERLSWMDTAGIAYWKVDWGKKDRSEGWRSFVTALAKSTAPHLHIEHAMIPSLLSTAEIYRTYDVEAIISLPHTLARIGSLLSYLPEGRATSIINCEDEPYIAVGTGCAIGIMRHGFNGPLPNGVQDIVFPPVGKNYKNCMDEVTRAVRWHRIAAPFAINQNTVWVDTAQLHDYWVMGEHETWMDRKPGYVNGMSAPATIARGLEKPVVKMPPGEDTVLPYVLASRYPNGAIAVAAIGRTLGRQYLTPRADVTIRADDISKPVGVFGYFNSLTIQLPKAVSLKRVVAQDLAGDKPVTVTAQITVRGNEVVIPGALIEKIGLVAATKGDTSEPGLVLSFE